MYWSVLPAAVARERISEKCRPWERVEGVSRASSSGSGGTMAIVCV